MRVALAALLIPAAWTVGLVQPGPLHGQTAKLRAGAATTDITPKKGVSLDGPISKNGPVIGVHDRLSARALALDDGSTRLAIVICDACMIGREVFDAAKKRVQQQSGLPANRMLMAATHTHAAVRAIHIGTSPLDDEYHQLLARRIADAVMQAEKNLTPARIGYASFEKPEYVGCRRFLCQPGSVGANPFGERDERIKSVAGTSTAVIEPAGPVDQQVSIVSVQHADGKPLAVLSNFSAHYCGGYRRGLVSADYFGHYAAALEAKLSAGEDRPPFAGILSNGTSGDTASIQRGGQSYAAFEWMQTSARALARETLKTIEEIEHHSDVTLGMKEVELELAVRRPNQKRLKWASEVLANPRGPHPHRWSTVYAHEARHLSSFPETAKLKLQAVRVGEIAIAAIPCEVFAETGLAIKKESPHRFTFTIELANGYGGYLPPREQHKLGGYETWPARSSFLEVDAESKIRPQTLQLLREVKATRCAGASPSHPQKNPQSPLMLDLPQTGTEPAKIDFAQLPRVPSQHATISDVRDRGGKWVNQHGYLTVHAGRYWAMWSDGPGVPHVAPERHRNVVPGHDRPGTRVSYATSEDGLKWSRPQDLSGPPREEGFGWIARGFWVREGALLALASHFNAPGYRGRGLSLEAFRWDQDKQKWLRHGTVHPDTLNNFPPKRLPTGDWMMTRRDHRGDVSVLIGGTQAFDQWKVRPLASYGGQQKPEEPYWYVLPDGKNLVGLIRDNSGSKRLLRTFSTDHGRSWTPITRTNFPDATSKFFALRTSRGDYALVSNANPRGRDPLTLALSSDGLTYRRLFRLVGGRHVDYPHMIEHQGHLLISFSSAKQTVEVLKVPLSAVDELIRRHPSQQ